MSHHAGGFLLSDQPSRLVEAAESQYRVARAMGGRGGARGHPPQQVRLPSVAPSLAQGDDWLPAWVRAHVERKSTVKDVLEDGLERVGKTPDQQTLLEGQLVLNELGRDPRNAELVRGTVQKVSRMLLRSED